MTSMHRTLAMLGALVAADVAVYPSLAAGQATDLAAIVDSFYPQSLTDLAVKTGVAPVREQCFDVLEFDAAGHARVIIAAYTNLTLGTVRVLTANGSGFQLVAEPTGEDHAGWTCEVHRVDVDLDGRYEAHVKFVANNGSLDWIYAWNGQQLVNLTPTTASPLGGALDTNLINASFVDTDGDRILEIYSPSVRKGDEPPSPAEIYRLTNGHYVLDRPVAGAYEFIRSNDTPTIEVVDVAAPKGGQGPFRLRVFNGTGTGTRVENAVESGRVWFNGQELVRPNDFGNQVVVIERTVNLQTENELKVRLAGTPGGHITIVIDAASWTP
ncbi:MAG: hypothetical protein ACREUU_04525 [Gammaproteobacteria bacterium]